MRKLFKLSGIIFVIVFTSFLFYFYHNYTIPILMYHSLDANRIGNYAAVAPEVFYQQMKFIKEKGYKVILLDDYCKLINGNEPIPKKLVIITFDDGYKDNLEAIRVLKELDYPATIFLVVEDIGKAGYLSKEDITYFIKNSKVRIGSHTYSGAYLPDADNNKLKQEIFASKQKLQKLFLQEIETIAYPSGGFNKKVIEEVREANYLCGCTTNRGFSGKLNKFALRRIKITNRDLGLRFWSKLSGFYNVFRKVKRPH